MNDSEIDFLYLSEEDMIKAGVTDMKACIDTMEEMFRLLKLGDYRMGGANNNSHGAMVSFPPSSPFPEMPVSGPDRRFMAMPAYLGGRFDMAGVKWYGSNVENRKKGLPRSILMLTLNDKDTGAPVAYMSANLLSAYRTGAVPGVGFRYFSKEDARIVGIIGPGVMNRTALAAMLAVRPTIDTVKIKGSRPDSLSTKAYVQYIQSEFPQIKTVQVVDSIEEAVRNSDIVSIAISGTMGSVEQYPYVKEEWIKPGAVFSCPAAARFDEDFILHRARNITDNIHLYEAWQVETTFPTYACVPMPAMNCLDLITEGKMTSDRMDDLGDVILGNVPVHRNENEIVIYSVGGMPIEDVAWGTVCYRKAKELQIGVGLNLWKTPELI